MRKRAISTFAAVTTISMSGLASAADMASSRTMAGMYSYLADAAMFRTCSTGERYAVAFEEDNIALERAYLEVVEEAGSEVLVFVQVRIEERPAMEGDGTEIHVIPEKFLSIDGEADCSTLGDRTS